MWTIALSLSHGVGVADMWSVFDWEEDGPSPGLEMHVSCTCTSLEGHRTVLVARNCMIRWLIATLDCYRLRSRILTYSWTLPCSSVETR